MKKSFSKKLMIFAFTLGMFSCNEGIELQDISIDAAISEYQTFYEEQMYNHRTKVYANIPQKNPQWEKATIKSWARGSAAIIPLDYDKNYFIRISTSPYSMVLDSSSFLLLNKGSDGIMEGEIVYLIPDGMTSRSDKNGQSRFSGTILVESLHGEFLASYNSQPDGTVLRYSSSDGMASTEKVSSESIECITYEFWQKTSTDGGETWSEPILLSSHTECYYVTESFNYIAEDYYELGRGGGASSQSFRSLTAAELMKLEEVRLKLSLDCATNNIENTVWNSLKFNVNGSIGSPAQYNSGNNTITFRDSPSINLNNILEEVYHAYQNTIYPGGISQYSLFKPGFTNIEFEAKLFKDVYSVLYGGMISGNPRITVFGIQ